MAAVTYRNVAVVKMLIDRGANVNWANGKGSTALGAALRSHQDWMVEVLRNAGAVEALPQAIEDSTPAESAVDSRPILLNTPQPVYTTKARNERIQGVVRARVLVGSDGTVRKVRILTGLPYGLSYQAMDAAFQLIFKPAIKNGQPIEFWLSVEMEFKLA
jgi:TonB family protein